MRILILLAAASAVIAAALASWSPAEAAVCGVRASIVAELERQWGETRRVSGLQGKGRGIVEVWASDETGSWTILVTDTAGRACMLAAGEAFQEEEAQPKGEAL